MATATATKTAVQTDTVNITNKPEVIAAAKRAAELKAIEAAGKAAEKERKQIEDEILRPALGNASKGILRGVVAFKLQPSSNSNINRVKLAEAFPEAYEATYEKTPYTFFKYSA